MAFIAPLAAVGGGRFFPEMYSVQSKGDCLGPVLSGALWSVSSLDVPKEGDIVALWLLPGRYSDGTEGDEIGHRVARSEACLIKIMFKQDADSVTVLMLNPLATATFPRSDIVAMHKAIALRTPDGVQRLLRAAA
ncbi:hypothetical protein FJ976_24070 [Mesorhizobium sp. B1-1-9]|uniref:hypothetical protein n=1 Tax=Mesorhizobium sp. B1-1-9 TaxID=2589975 RepID=UPI00112B2EE0|nr:hypothetical protein [Mesorhizobium sp. B1-1-9]TPN45314.1 hypothetical protein FJ976_24070 [Mesorhizobium sp. B1-1-9]